MLAGKVPLDDPSAMSVALKHLNDAPPPPHLFNPDLAPSVERVILKVLDKDPNNRYPSGALLTQALETAMLSDASEMTEKLPAGKRAEGSPTPINVEARSGDKVAAQAGSAGGKGPSSNPSAGIPIPTPDPFDGLQTAIGDSTPIRNQANLPPGSPSRNAANQAGRSSSRTALPMILLVVLLLAGLGVFVLSGGLLPTTRVLTPTIHHTPNCHTAPADPRAPARQK